MSSSLYWKPVNPTASYLSPELKYALRNRYNGWVKTTMDFDDISYLEGLLHAGVEDAQILIDAIEQYSEIEIWETY